MITARIMKSISSKEYDFGSSPGAGTNISILDFSPSPEVKTKFGQYPAKEIYLSIWKLGHEPKGERQSRSFGFHHFRITYGSRN